MSEVPAVQPPDTEPPAYADIVRLRYWDTGVRFFMLAASSEGVADMTAEDLEDFVRESPLFAFEDGETIGEASSHSDAELWSDAIFPAIAAGAIHVTVDGRLL